MKDIFHELLDSVLCGDYFPECVWEDFYEKWDNASRDKFVVLLWGAMKKEKDNGRQWSIAYSKAYACYKYICHKECYKDDCHEEYAPCLNQPLSTSLDECKLKDIFKGLVDGGFVSGEALEVDWLYIFGIGVNVAFKPIRWIAKNKKSKNPNKRSLLDLLSLLNVPEMEVKALINDYFIVDGASKSFNADDYKKIRKWERVESEYHSELIKIVNIGKQADNI